ncbi:hypothetical protein D9M69_729510 [compost metagenome]
MDDRIDTLAYELGRVVAHDIIQSFGHVFFQRGHGFANVFRDLQRVGAWLLEDDHLNRRLTVE